MKKVIAAVVSLLLLGIPAGRVLAGNTLDDVRKKGVLVAGVKSASPPFGFVDRNTGALAGYDVDFVKAIAARLGVKAVITPVTAANRVPQLVQGNVDIVAAAMPKTRDCGVMVDFSDTYYLTSQKVLAKTGTVRSVADLEGKRIGTAKGSAWEINVKMNVPGADVVSFDNASRATEALRGGAIDAVSTDEVILVRLLSKLPRGEYEIPPVGVSVEPYGLAVRKGDKKFLEAVNAAIREMEKTGEARTLYARWFDPRPDSAPADTAGGVVVRRSADMKRLVVMPIGGTFRPGADVSFFDPAGNFVAPGKVKSFYADEIYVDVDAEKAGNIDSGFIVGMNMSDAAAKDLVRKEQDLLKSIAEEIRRENATRIAEIGKEAKAMEEKRRKEQVEFERLKMQLDYTYDNYYYGWYGYPW